jgi:hypothetical protein
VGQAQPSPLLSEVSIGCIRNRAEKPEEKKHERGEKDESELREMDRNRDEITIEKKKVRNMKMNERSRTKGA